MLSSFYPFYTNSSSNLNHVSHYSRAPSKEDMSPIRYCKKKNQIRSHVASLMCLCVSLFVKLIVTHPGKIINYLIAWEKLISVIMWCNVRGLDTYNNEISLQTHSPPIDINWIKICSHHSHLSPFHHKKTLLTSHRYHNHYDNSTKHPKIHKTHKI